MHGWALWSPALIVASALVLIALERLLPYDRGQPLLREGFVTDFVWYALVQSYLLGLVISWLIGWLDGATGLSRLHLVTNWPVWVQLAFFFVTHDLYIYLFHRAQHRHQVLWRVHEAHHATGQVDWLSGARSHPLEILINQTIEFAPIVLLGAHPDVALMKGALDAVWGMYIHCNIDVRSGFLQRVINGPEMHRWHHTGVLPQQGDMNFGTKLAIWDWLFGTGYLPANKPPAYGLTGGKRFPAGYFGQTAYAFRPLDKTFGQAAGDDSATRESLA
jgi:sterol desaturase/sphingolipid hydroxylase (fatty acid hydroxylase superfamily)